MTREDWEKLHDSKKISHLMNEVERLDREVRQLSDANRLLDQRLHILESGPKTVCEDGQSGG
jgi:hypothetical protein